MSEYDVLINKYDALNNDYDQLYPKPMKHANTHASGGTDPITPGDIGAYSKNETDLLLSTKPGENLLDNSVFLPGCLVDQRQGYVVPPNTPYHALGDGVTIVGYTTKYETVGAFHYADSSTGKMWYCLTGDMSNYTITNDYIVRGYTGAVYGPDRWKNLGNGGGAGAVIINDGYVSFHNDANWIQVQQIIDLDLTGKTVTLSALKNDGELITATNVASTSFFYAGNLSGFYITFLISNNKSVVNIMNKLSTDVGIKAVKLELGSTQTLAHQDANGNWVLNEIPDYGEQLRRCQRYQLVLSGADAVIGNATYVRGKYAYVAVPLPVTMRGETNRVAVTLSGSVVMYYIGGSVVISELYPNSMIISQNIVQVIFQSSVDLTSGGIVCFADNNSKLIINRNL